jgi:Na+(H+)/acetate symporter ActP
MAAESIRSRLAEASENGLIVAALVGAWLWPDTKVGAAGVIFAIGYIGAKYLFPALRSLLKAE